MTGVLDIKDDTALVSSPGSSHLNQSPSHNRSILVLTPTEAIKFTTLTRERHVAWFTALNFLVFNDPADLIIPRGISTGPTQPSLWLRDPGSYANSVTASSIAASSESQQPSFIGSYTVRKTSLPDFMAPAGREEGSPLGYKYRIEDEYATPPSVPRIPTGRRFEGGRERSGSGGAGGGGGGGGVGGWDDGWGRETIRMDAFVKRPSPPPEEPVEIDHNLFREF